jgi:hypothetical protein
VPTTITPDPLQVIAPISLDDFDFDLEATPFVETVTPGSATAGTQQDMNIESIEGEVSRNGADLFALYSVGSTPKPVFIKASDPTKVTIVGNRVSGTRTAPGADSVKLALRSGSIARGINFTCQVSAGEDRDEFLSYRDGSAAKHCADQLEALAAFPGRSRSIFASRPARNVNCWLSDLDMSGVMAYRGTGTATIGSVVIAPDCVTGAVHAQFGVGSTMSFVTMAGEIVTRTLVSRQAVTGTDLVCWKLSSDLPSTIKPYKTLPADWNEYFPSLTNTEYDTINGITTFNVQGIMPIVAFRRDNQVITRDMRAALLMLQVNADALSIEPYYSHGFHELAPTGTNRNQYSTAIIGGDSGFPAFCVINGELIWLGNHWGPTTFAFAPDCIGFINAAMAAVDSDYTIQTVDLSEFNNYG